VSREAEIKDALREQDVHRPGVYRGIVEGIDDPERLGRLRVRIYELHGPETRTSREALPWAEVAEQWGGGYDFGSFSAPSIPVGSGVWVMFERGHYRYPVVIGTYRANPEFAQPMNTVGGRVKSDGSEEAPDPDATWVPSEDQEETPHDVFFEKEEGDNVPTRTLLYKSPKGHTIYAEDRGGEEAFVIVDRAGQVIEMSCGVETTPAEEGAVVAEGEEQAAPNANNTEQRGIRSSIRGDQLDQEAMVAGKSYIRLKDLAGQEVILDPTLGDERIILRNTNKENTQTQEFEMGLRKGSPIVRLEGANGDKFVMDANSDTPMIMEDHSGNAIIFNAQDGTIKQVTRGGVEEEHNKINSRVRGDKSREIGGNEDTTVLGNRRITVVNDDVLSVLGSLQQSIGGSLYQVLTGLLTAPTGINPEDLVQDFAFDRLINIPTLVPVIPPSTILGTRKGSYRLRVNIGDIIRQITEGDMIDQITTGDILRSIDSGDFMFDINLGSFSWTTQQGDIDWLTELGDVSLKANGGTLLIEVTPVGKGKATIEVNADGDIHCNTGPNDLVMIQATGETTLEATQVNIVSNDINLSAKSQTDYFMCFTAWLNIWNAWHAGQFLTHVHTSSAPGSPTSPPTAGIVNPTWTPCRAVDVKADPTG